MDRPAVGDLVQVGDGPEQVVTDIRRGVPIVRPLAGGGERPVEDPASVTVVARRGTWGRRPGHGRS